MKNIAVFTNALGHVLTIAAVKGKASFNVKASIKESKGKGQPKARTGCRASFDNAEEAQTMFDARVEEATTNGWTRIPKHMRNSFTSIPKVEPVPAPVVENAQAPKLNKQKSGRVQ